MKSTSVLFAFVLLGMGVLAAESIVNLHSHDDVEPFVTSLGTCSSPKRLNIYFNVRPSQYPALIHSVTLNVTVKNAPTNKFYSRATIVRPVFENYHEVTTDDGNRYMFAPETVFPPVAVTDPVDGEFSADDETLTFTLINETSAQSKMPYIFDSHTFIHIEMADCDISLQYSIYDNEFLIYSDENRGYNFTPALLGSGLNGYMVITEGATVTTQDLIDAGMNSSFTVNDYLDDICTCEMGIPDRACQLESTGPMNAVGCSSGYVCMLDMCIQQEIVYSNADCQTNGRLFGSNGVCDCGCFDDDSALDIDCYYPNRYFLYNDTTFSSGLLVGQCNGVTAQCNSSVPTCYGELWTCPLSKYHDGKTCECFCGYYDPDCNMSLELPSDCEENFYCHTQDPANLSSQMCWAPRGWTSSTVAFNASKTTCECIYGVPSAGCYDTISGTYSENAILCEGMTDAVVDKNRICLPNGTCMNIACGSGYMGPEVSKRKQCDGGNLCNPKGSKTPKGVLNECECSSWSYIKNPQDRGCASKCGDGSRAGDEECELTPFCNNLTCRCLPGHPVVNYSDRNYGCSGCGNFYRDSDEECDGGEGCLSNCRCDRSNGWRPKDDKALDCEQTTTLIPIIAGGAVAAALVIAAIVALFIIVNHFKTDEQKAARKVRQSENAVKTAKDNNAKITFDSKSALVPQPKQAGPDPALLASLNISTEGGGMNIDDEEAE